MNRRSISSLLHVGLILGSLNGCGGAPFSVDPSKGNGGPDGGSTGPGEATCSDVCKHAAAICGIQEPAGCVSKCESSLSPAGRDCAVQVTQCSAIGACQGQGPGVDAGGPPGNGNPPDGGGPVAPSPDASTGDISSPQDLANAWDAWAAATLADANQNQVNIEWWNLKVIINGNVAKADSFVSDPSSGHRMIASLQFGAADKVDATFGLQALIGGASVIWREKHIPPKP